MSDIKITIDIKDVESGIKAIEKMIGKVKFKIDTKDVESGLKSIEKAILGISNTANALREKQKRDELSNIRELRDAKVAAYDAELESVKQEYARKLLAAKKYKTDIKKIEEEQAAEIEEIERAREVALLEYKWELREISAEKEEEYLEIQKQRIEARYEAEMKAAEDNKDLQTEINEARVAEEKRIAARLLDIEYEATQKKIDTYMGAINAIAKFAGANAEVMRGIAIFEAGLNTAVAVTKAATAAPWPANLVPIGKAIALGATQIAAIKKEKFAQGGIVGGNSYYGDFVPVRVNSGEMVLNKEQQKELFDIANGKQPNETDRQIVINFSPQIANGMNKEDVRKMLKENQAEFAAFVSKTVATGFGKTGVFV